MQKTKLTLQDNRYVVDEDGKVMLDLLDFQHKLFRALSVSLQEASPVVTRDSPDWIRRIASFKALLDSAIVFDRIYTREERQAYARSKQDEEAAVEEALFRVPGLAGLNLH